MSIRTDLERAWVLFLYAQEDYQKMLQQLAAAETLMKQRKAELDAQIKLQWERGKDEEAFDIAF